MSKTGDKVIDVMNGCTHMWQRNTDYKFCTLCKKTGREIELEAKVEGLEKAVKKHFEFYVCLENYPNFGQADVELWKAFGIEGES